MESSPRKNRPSVKQVAPLSCIENSNKRLRSLSVELHSCNGPCYSRSRCLTQLPPGETNPLSARARSWQTKTTAKISVGLLPYISIVSVWQRRRPVVTNLGACHHRLCIDTSSCRLVTLAELTASANAIPRRSYLFGASWPDVRRTLLMAVEQDGDPFAVMVPTAEIIRFYYAPSTRLAQALFWGEYKDTFDAERSGSGYAVSKKRSSAFARTVAYSCIRQ